MEGAVVAPHLLGLPRRVAVGVLLTIAGILAAHTLAILAGPEATLQRVAIVLVVVPAVFAGVHGGRVAGLVSGTLGGLYAIFFFSTFGTREESTARLVLGSAIGLTIFGLSLLVGQLRWRADAANERALEREREGTRAARVAATQLAETNAELRRVNAALRSANEGLEAFSYVVAHDLKEPVRAMAALLEDAEVGTVRPVVRESLHAARLANERLAKLLSGLLEVAHASLVEPGDLVPLHPLDVLEGSSCVARYASLRDERGARIETTSLVGTPPVLATEDHLCQILGNLVLNALRHTDKTSPLVRVSVAPQDADGDMVLLSVEDDGPGFPQGVAEQLTLAKQRPLAVRGGFGLVIVRRAVERLGGNVWFGRSADLGGAAVHLTLPSARPAKVPASTRRAEAREGAASRSAGRR